MSEMVPTVYVAHWTSRASGEHVWQVTERGMPLCAETTDREGALIVYQQRRQRSLRWISGERRYDGDIPEDPPIWNGDLGEFESPAIDAEVVPS